MTQDTMPDGVGALGRREPGTPATAPCAVVVGPLTRLGGALAQELREQTRVFALARNADDLAGLAALPVTPMGEQPGRTLFQQVTPERLTLFVCALGPVHPGAPRTAEDAAAFARDLGLIDDLLESAGGLDVHVVLVSSVIAFAPGEDRRYYGGWKCLVEQELRRLVERQAPRATLSVVYPGRLMTARERTRPWHRAHTSYETLARLLVETDERPVDARVVGLDARAWLVTHGLSVAFRSLSGPRGRRRGAAKGRPSTGTERRDA